MIFERKKKKLVNTERVFWISLHLLPEIFLILRRIERDIIKNGLHVKYPLLLSDFHENGIFFTDFLKIFNIKFHENPSSGNRVAPCGRTDRHTRRSQKAFFFFFFFAILRTGLKWLYFIDKGYSVFRLPEGQTAGYKSISTRRSCDRPNPLRFSFVFLDPGAKAVMVLKFHDVLHA
jgi:hypothetical protein